MKKYIYLCLIAALSVYMLGCGKKKPLAEEQLSMDSLGILGTETTPAANVEQPQAETNVQEIPAPAMKEAQVEPQAIIPANPNKPTVQEVQTALRNAGYYTGSVDGKVGSMTRKATEEFQQANGLKVDGKVGPKTWSALSKYLQATSKQPKAGE